MGKVFVVLCCTIFVCGVVARFFVDSSAAAFGNHHGITYLMLVGAVTFFGSWKLVGK